MKLSEKKSGIQIKSALVDQLRVLFKCVKMIQIQICGKKKQVM